MSKKNKKKKVLSKNERTQREFEHQRLALEKRKATSSTFPKVKSYLNVKKDTPTFAMLGEKVELTSIQIDPNLKQVVHLDESGVRTVISDIEEIRLMTPSSQAWKEYLKAGGDPDIPDGEIPIQVITKDTKTGASNGIGVATATTNALDKLSDITTILPSGLVGRQNHLPTTQSSEMLPLIVKSIHPSTRKVLSSTKILTLLESSTMGKFSPQNGLEASKELVDTAMTQVKTTASVDPNEEILLKDLPAGMKLDAANDTEESAIFYSSLLKAGISPGINNKEENLVYDLLTDTTTRRIRFDQLNYPVWEGHTTHPTRNEGFITKPPFPKMYIQFNDFVELPTQRASVYSKSLVEDHEQDEPLDAPVPLARYKEMSFEEMSIAIGSIAFSNDIQHVLIRKNSSGTTRTILPQEGKTWKITPPQGTDPKYDGYSSEKNDSIMLGYLRWFGLLLDSNRETIGKLSRGAYFDINTGTVWIPLNELAIIAPWDTGQAGEALSRTDENIFDMEKNREITHLIPAGSGIDSSAVSADLNSNRKLSIFEDSAIRVGDIFMFMMNYMTSPRMQTEEVQGTRSERRRAQKQGLPPPPPWTTISYKPPSSIKRNSVSTGTGSKHSYMYDVRGHWKNQPHGPGREQRKLIWVHPHYSGLANEKYVPRNRLVQEKEEHEN